VADIGFLQTLRAPVSPSPAMPSYNELLGEGIAIGLRKDDAGVDQAINRRTGRNAQERHLRHHSEEVLHLRHL
jgi:hypothetical protein